MTYHSPTASTGTVLPVAHVNHQPLHYFTDCEALLVISLTCVQSLIFTWVHKVMNIYKLQMAMSSCTALLLAASQNGIWFWKIQFNQLRHVNQQAKSSNFQLKGRTCICFLRYSWIFKQWRYDHSTDNTHGKVDILTYIHTSLGNGVFHLIPCGTHASI